MTLTTFDVSLGLKNAWRFVTIYDISKNYFFLLISFAEAQHKPYIPNRKLTSVRFRYDTVFLKEYLPKNYTKHPRQLTFFCSNSSQLIFSKKTWSLISLASVGPPPNLLAGSLTRRPSNKSLASAEILTFRGNLTSSTRILPNIMSVFWL